MPKEPAALWAWAEMLPPHRNSIVSPSNGDSEAVQSVR